MPQLRERAPKRAPSPLPSDVSFSESEEEPQRKNKNKPSAKKGRASGQEDFDYDAVSQTLGIDRPQTSQGTAWLPQEDKLLITAYGTIGPKWAEVAKALQNKGFARTHAMCRNRYQRMTYDSSRSRRNDGPAKNRCKKCGQIKRGHTCLASLLPEQRQAPIKRVRVAEPAKAAEPAPTPSLGVWTMEDVVAAPSSTRTAKTTPASLPDHSLLTAGFPGVQLTADYRGVHSFSHNNQIGVEPEALSSFLDAIHKRNSPPTTTVATPRVVPALPVSGPHSFFLASAAPPPIVHKLGVPPNSAGPTAVRQMSSMSSIGDVANACDLSELVDLSDLQSAAISAIASKSFASFGNNNNAPAANNNATTTHNNNNNNHPAGLDSPTVTSETTDIVPPGFVPPPPAPPPSLEAEETTPSDVAALLTSNAISKALLWGPDAYDGNNALVPPGYVPPPPDYDGAMSTMPALGCYSMLNNPSFSRAPSFSWIDNCLNSTPESAASRAVSFSKAAAAFTATTPKVGVPSSLPTPEKVTAAEKIKPPALEALKALATAQGALEAIKPLLCEPPPPAAKQDLDEKMSMLPEPEMSPPMPRKQRSKEWGNRSFDAGFGA